MRVVTLVLTLSAVLGGCQQARSTEPLSVANEPVEVGKSLEPDDQLVRLAERGSKALALGDADAPPAEDLLSAVTLFRQSGATPAHENEVNLVEDWAADLRRSGLSVRAPAYRGRVLGPGYRSGGIQPGEAFATEQVFLAGKLAKVSVASTSAGERIRLAIDDANGKPVCRKSSDTRGAGCSFVPMYSGRFVISLENPSRERVQFVLVTN